MSFFLLLLFILFSTWCTLPKHCPTVIFIHIDDDDDSVQCCMCCFVYACQFSAWVAYILCIFASHLLVHSCGWFSFFTVYNLCIVHFENLGLTQNQNNKKKSTHKHILTLTIYREKNYKIIWKFTCKTNKKKGKSTLAIGYVWIVMLSKISVWNCVFFFETYIVRAIIRVWILKEGLHSMQPLCWEERNST